MPEKLEVNEEAAQLRLERQLRVVGSSSGLISGPPSIGPVARSSILDNVKRFLPEMAKADEDLQQRIESGENLDIEECSGTDVYSLRIDFAKITFYTLTPALVKTKH